MMSGPKVRTNISSVATCRPFTASSVIFHRGTRWITKGKDGHLHSSAYSSGQGSRTFLRLKDGGTLSVLSRDVAVLV